MRFSIFRNGRVTALDQDRQFIPDTINHAGRAEELGFNAVFLPDRHFTGYMPIASDPMMFAAYLSARFPRLLYGFFSHLGAASPRRMPTMPTSDRLAFPNVARSK